MLNQFSIASIQQRMAEGVPIGRGEEQIVRRLWWAALDILQQEILLPMDLKKGLWFASPLPALYEPKLLSRFQGWLWTPEEFSMVQSSNVGSLPPTSVREIDLENISICNNFQKLSLHKEDGYDPLLIIITEEIQIALALHGNHGERNLLMRSDPETLTDVLKILNKRLNAEETEKAQEIRDSLAGLGTLRTNDDIAKVFWPSLASKLAEIAPSLTIKTYADFEKRDQVKPKMSGEISLLEALTHEIKTPLATIRTLIRSLIRRSDLSKTVLSRLKFINNLD